MGQAHRTKAQLLGELEALDVEWRRAQDALQQRERFNRLLVENSLGLMCSHDLDGVLLSINPAAAHSLGYEPDDGIGRNLREFPAPAVQPLFDAYLERIRYQPSDSGLLRLLARDGSERVW
jgi:PAS domain S-box-containing protein